MRSKKEKTLTSELAGHLKKELLPDLQERAAQPQVKRTLQAEHAAEVKAKRTADSYSVWETRTLEQIAAAWVLSCVFVRTLEDRSLLDQCRIAGEGAKDSERLFFEIAPSLSTKDYLLTIFSEVAAQAGAEDLLGRRHNPVWMLGPSNDAAKGLVDFFRELNDVGELRWRFGPGENSNQDDTRYLGDLYQDLSEDIQKRYALLQTPDFVEEFILDHTLSPAIEEFGLEEVRLIDPTCGSGHFLLGAFDRILDARLRNAPAVDIRDHAMAALEQVYGVDLNPYAVAIARFRLTLAFVRKVGVKRLADVPKLSLNLVVADSLLHGVRNTNRELVQQPKLLSSLEALQDWGASVFALDDPAAAERVLSQGYHAVVGNPPYIRCKDKALKERYKASYRSCYREYGLSAPFTERFFQLAREQGFVGLINANAFMKREFGKALVEKVLPHLDLTGVIDSSGAYIPGHGTPTVILFGRNRRPVAGAVQAVLGKRGEPSTPQDPSQGKVWLSIQEQLENTGFDNEFISVSQISREKLNSHPWSLSGGGAGELKSLLESRAEKQLHEVVDVIGFGCITKQDPIFAQPLRVFRYADIEQQHLKPFAIGEEVRDWNVAPGEHVLFPYDEHIQTATAESIPRMLQFMWRWRSVLEDRKVFGGETYRSVGKPWFEFGQIPADRYKTPLSITFAFVATHNHFVLDRGGKVFNRTAPIIKLPEGATEDEHLALLAYLNSSTACFWMKQVCQNKGSEESIVFSNGKDGPRYDCSRGTTGGGGGFEFSGTPLKQLPVPDWPAPVRARLVALARHATDVAQTLTQASTAGYDSHAQYQLVLMELQSQVVATQEEIDWVVYAAIGLASEELQSAQQLPLAAVPIGLRPFEMLLARQAKGTECSVVGVDGQQLAEKGPSSWDATRSALWERRVAAIQANSNLQMLEAPAFKRRWIPLDTEAKWASELQETFLDASEMVCENGTRQVTRLRQVLEGVVPSEKTELRASELAALLGNQCVPFATAALFNESGLMKHREWQNTWALQRREDAGENVGTIPVPPKYKSTDFQKPSYWKLRGKLDVPKERFISYPGCEKDGDDSMLIGWAGWNHFERAQALYTLYLERKNQDGWEKVRLMPMLVGMWELLPWLKQWHSEPINTSQNPAQDFANLLAQEMQTYALTDQDLKDWRPPKKAKRKKKSNSAKKSKTQKTTKAAANKLKNASEHNITST